MVGTRVRIGGAALLLTSLALVLAVVLVACNSVFPAPTVTSFAAKSATLASFGESTTLSWSGSHVTDYSLSVSPDTGVMINGSAYAGAVDLGTSTSVSVALPGNSTSSVIGYAFTLTAASRGVATPVTTTTVVVVEGLSATVYSSDSDYGFWGPQGIAVDANDDIWVACTGGYVTELPAGKFTNPIKYSGAGYGFDGPEGIAVDASGNIWITNTSGDSVTELPSGNYTSPIVYSGHGYGFYSPEAIAADASGNIWTTNWGRYYQLPPYFWTDVNRVTELPSGNYTSPTLYSGTGYGLNAPEGIAVDTAGNIWITNMYGNSVTELPSGSYTNPTVYSAADYGFNQPRGVAADGAGNIWVTNSAGTSVTELPSGNYTSPIVYSGADYGFNQPDGVAADASGNIWITNWSGNSVTELPSGNYTNPIVYSGTGYAFSNPAGVAYDASGNIWVANSGWNDVTEIH